MIKEYPLGLALIVCDTIIEDRLTGKKSLIGLFSHLGSPSFPVVHPQLTVMVSLTSGRGHYPCEVSCTHLNGDVAFNGKGEFDLENPHQVVDIAFNFFGVRFTKSGIYNLSFTVDEFPIMTRRIFIDQTELKHN